MRSDALVNLSSPTAPANVEPLSIESLAGSLDVRLAHVCNTRLYDQQRMSIAEIIEDLSKYRPITVLGLSLPRGTLSQAETFMNSFIQAGLTYRYLVLGGSMPTSRPDLILSVFPQAIAVQGFGEDTLVELIQRLSKNQVIYQAPNLAFLNKSAELVSTYSKHTELAKLPLPRREFVPSLIRTGGIINAETSRNCSFAASHTACTFCVRDPRFLGSGRREVYIRGTVERALADVEQLVAAGVQQVNYVDEEFLGGDYLFADEFAKDITSKQVAIKFLFSSRIDSIWSARDTPEVNFERSNSLRHLKAAGLCRIFIGLESASTSQLKRYHKGYTAQAILPALQVLRKIGIQPEVGFILFDPLVTIQELRENIEFLKVTGLWKYLSANLNKLDVSDGGNYLEIVKKAEIRSDRRLLGAQNRDTLDYQCSYLSTEVERIIHVVDQWLLRAETLYYSLKSVSRGRFEAQGTDRKLDNTRAFLSDFRWLELSFIDALVSAVEVQNEDLNAVYNLYLGKLNALVQKLGKSLDKHEIFDSLDIIAFTVSRMLAT